MASANRRDEMIMRGEARRGVVGPSLIAHPGTGGLGLRCVRPGQGVPPPGHGLADGIVDPPVAHGVQDVGEAPRQAPAGRLPRHRPAGCNRTGPTVLRLPLTEFGRGSAAKDAGVPSAIPNPRTHTTPAHIQPPHDLSGTGGRRQHEPFHQSTPPPPKKNMGRKSGG